MKPDAESLTHEAAAVNGRFSFEHAIALSDESQETTGARLFAQKDRDTIFSSAKVCEGFCGVFDGAGRAGGLFRADRSGRALSRSRYFFDRGKYACNLLIGWYNKINA